MKIDLDIDASCSTAGVSKTYLNVIVNNYVELFAAKDRMLAKPPNTVLCIFFPSSE